VQPQAVLVLRAIPAVQVLTELLETQVLMATQVLEQPQVVRVPRAIRAATALTELLETQVLTVTQVQVQLQVAQVALHLHLGPDRAVMLVTLEAMRHQLYP
jgi:hypothetical protein